MAGHTVQVSVLADTRRFTRSMKGVSDDLKGWGRDLGRLGSTFKQTGRRLTNWITKPALGVAAAGAGITAAFGWKRLVSLDTARGQFKGLGYEAGQIEAIMDGVDKGVTGTSLSVADGASLMVGALATGNLTLKDTEAYTRRVANVSAAYGVEASQAGYLLNNVLTKNKVTWGDLSQMQRNQIPIVTMLADKYGVAGDEIMKMAQDGRISIEDLNEALDTNAGAAAEEYGKTWAGVTANIRANIGRIGAALLGPAFERIKARAQDFLDQLRSPQWGAAAEQLGEKIGDAIDGIIDKIESVIGWWQDLDDKHKDMLASFAGLAIAIGPTLMLLGHLTSGIGGILITAGKIKGLFAGLGAALASPFVLVAAALAVVGGALWWFFTQTETGKKTWDRVWGGIKDTAERVKKWFVADALPVLEAVWDGIVQAAKDALAWYQEHVEPVFVAIGDLFKALWEEAILPALENIKEQWEQLWTGVQEAWEQYGAPIKETIETAFNNMKDALQTAWDNIVLIVETALAVITHIIDAVTAAIRGDWEGAWQSIKDAASVAWEGIKGVVSNAIESARRQIERVLGLIQAQWDRAWTWISQKVSSVWDTIKTSVSAAVEFIKTAINTALEAIKTWWSTAWNGVKTTVTVAWVAIRTTVREGANRVVGFIRGLPGRARTALAGIGTTLINAGRQLIQGFIDGITAGFQRVRDKLGELTDLLPDWKGPAARDKTILKDAGQLVIDGFIDGLESRYGNVRRSLTGLTRDVANTAFDPLDVGETRSTYHRPIAATTGAMPTDQRPIELTVYLGDEQITNRMEIIADGRIGEARRRQLASAR